MGLRVTLGTLSSITTLSGDTLGFDEVEFQVQTSQFISGTAVINYEKVSFDKIINITALVYDGDLVYHFFNISSSITGGGNFHNIVVSNDTYNTMYVGEIIKLFIVYKK